MPEQSAIAYQEGRKAFVAGISWQPISQSGYSKRTAEIRELADRIDATRQIQLKTSYGVYVGLYNYDPDISDEERKGRMFSLAALLAKKVGTQNTILFWRIKEGYRKDEVALIVIEEGAPSLDFVASENEAMSTLQSYIDGSVNNTVYQLFTNAPDLLPNATLTDQTLLAGQFKNEYAFQALPTDFIKAGGIMTLVILAAGGLYYGNEYMIDQENKERLARAQAQVDTPRYLAALRSAQKAIGLPASEVQAMLNKLLEQPFVAKGWVLDTIVCQTGNCTSTWNSKGGYTEELIGFLYNQTPVSNPTVFNKNNKKLFRYVRANDKVDDPMAMYLCDIYTIPTNLAGHPAMSVPFGTGAHGMPVGIQVLAPALGEAPMFRVGGALENAAGGVK